MDDSFPCKQTGRVLTVYGREVLISMDGSVRSATLGGRLVKVQRSGIVVPGDNVVLKMDERADLLIVDVQPRGSVLTRTDRRGRPYALVANLDLLVVVVTASHPAFSPILLDRMLAGGEAGGMDCLICINKVDLAKPAPAYLTAYPPLGYPVVKTSALTGKGMAELRGMLRGRTSALVGASGTGKSSMINRMLGASVQEVGSLSSRMQLGRRTTSAIRFRPLADGNGLVGDTPGASWLGDLPMNPRDIAYLFPEMRSRQYACRFADCTHLVEPGCAVRAAVESGDIHDQRFKNYAQLTRGTQQWGG